MIRVTPTLWRRMCSQTTVDQKRAAFLALNPHRQAAMAVAWRNRALEALLRTEVADLSKRVKALEGSVNMQREHKLGAEGTP